MKVQRFPKENFAKIPKNFGWNSDFFGKSDDDFLGQYNMCVTRDVCYFLAKSQKRRR